MNIYNMSNIGEFFCIVQVKPELFWLLWLFFTFWNNYNRSANADCLL